jgi:N-acyl-D-amino-acid deacylase
MTICDLLLLNATVFDGTGQTRRQVHVAVHQGVILAVGDTAQRQATRTLDLQGQALAPGFIDVHTHDDRLLLSDPSMAPKISQGATTVITGNCGISLAPLGAHKAVPPLNLVADGPGQRFDSFAAYFDALASNPPAVNSAALIGHTTLRAVTMGALDRPANAAEIVQMQDLVREALQAGSLGVSTGTYYAPAQAASADEIRDVCAPLREIGRASCRERV